jgi:hypothetical protein
MLAYLSACLVCTYQQDHLFAPDADAMYGPHHSTYVDVEVRTYM